MDQHEGHRYSTVARTSSRAAQKCYPDEPWRIEKEPHNCPDGTTHFNHVRQTAYISGAPLAVAIASHVTPDLAELLVLMRNNLPELIRLARLGLDVQG